VFVKLNWNELVISCTPTNFGGDGVFDSS